MIEKAISYQITNYLRDNDLEESLQSAYKIFHSTETALVKAHNDIVSPINNQSYIITAPWPICSFWHFGSQDFSAETLLSFWY